MFTSADGEMKRQVVLAALLPLFGGWACGSDVARTDEIADREQTWKANEPERYVVQTCTLGTEPPGCVREAIDGDEVVTAEERIFYPTAPGWQVHKPQGKMLDQMFLRVMSGERGGCVAGDVEYNNEFGFVSRYTFDCGDSLMGGRWVACFRPDEQVLSVCDVEP